MVKGPVYIRPLTGQRVLGIGKVVHSFSCKALKGAAADCSRSRYSLCVDNEGLKEYEKT